MDDDNHHAGVCTVDQERTWYVDQERIAVFFKTGARCDDVDDGKSTHISYLSYLKVLYWCVQARFG